MATVAQQLAAFTDQLARLTEEVAMLTARDRGNAHIFDAGVEHGCELERAALLGRSTVRPCRPRSGHLKLV